MITDEQKRELILHRTASLGIVSAALVDGDWLLSHREKGITVTVPNSIFDGSKGQALSSVAKAVKAALEINNV